MQRNASSLRSGSVHIVAENGIVLINAKPKHEDDINVLKHLHFDSQ